MSMEKGVWLDGINKSTVTATIHSYLTVGLTLADEYGQRYVLVYNDADTVILPTNACTPKNATTTGYSVTVSTISSQSRLAGVPVVTIATNYFGFVQTSGFKAGLKSESAIASAGLAIGVGDNGAFAVKVNASGVTGATGCGTAG